MKTGIVCEGGAMRGVYTSGVLQAFMEGGFLADLLVGVSAGASNGVSYVSHQLGRGYRTNVDYAGDKRYLSFQNLCETGSLFGFDFIFDEIPNHLDPFDAEAFHASPCDFYAGALDIETGETVFFGKKDIQPGFHAVRASCSMPLLSQVAEYGGHKLLDGGIGQPIPIDKALAEGCDRLVVVLTRERGYRKKPMGMLPLYYARYRAYPKLLQAIRLRHLVYNHTLQRLFRLEAEGRAILVAPDAPLGVGRFGQDREKLINAYEIGHQKGLEALDKIL
ncbi:patatin family protein [Ruminococcaceae bacterium OttesenSCG-928-I18]|nr:patatin family protein [Ruminococcaceae bacterium OttesenSCG-928-I18]